MKSSLEEFSPNRESFEALLQERRAALRTELESVLAARPPSAPVVLEIGAGHGHYLTSYAKEHPGHWCLGIDLMKDRVRRAERKRDRAGLPNLHFLRGDATEFLRCLPDQTFLERIFVLFPDPWPKTRHHKNRLLAPSFFTSLASRSSPTARLFFRTDHRPYFDEVAETLATHPDWTPTGTESWPFEAPTVFQQRAICHNSLIASYLSDQTAALSHTTVGD